MTAEINRKFDVGGIMLDRPFKVRRLGHFHFFSNRMKESLRFYTDLLGFAITDATDMSHRVSSPELRASLDDTKLYFTRYATDHHSFIVSSADLEVARGKKLAPRVTVGQITWQVGSLAEVVNGERWFRDAQVPIVKSGRDTPGSNWHTYIRDPDGQPNEIYYGIEQIGWDGYSKPDELHRGFLEPPQLPQISEYREVEDALAKGVNLLGGYRYRETRPMDIDVDGILMARPFKITALGPVRLLVGDMEKSIEFYRDRIGLTVTEEIVWNGHRCVFLRANTEHHSMALYPDAIAAELGLSAHSRCMSLGVRLNDYRQLRAATGFLAKNGVRIRYLPPELFPGMDYTAFAVDPDGHLVQLYCYMEQIGWDGRPRPPEQRRKIDNDAWPDVLDAPSDAYCGETYMGPWA
jgi:catechol 2,3-dioxygenase-like lactoylglutathione lyase family enzyme